MPYFKMVASIQEINPEGEQDIDLPAVAGAVARQLTVERERWFRMLANLLEADVVCKKLPRDISCSGEVEQVIKSFQIVTALQAIENQHSFKPLFDEFARMLTARVFEDDRQECSTLVNRYADLAGIFDHGAIYALIRQFAQDLSNAVTGRDPDMCASALIESIVYDLHSRTALLISYTLKLR